MEVQIANMLDGVVHVAVVRHSENALEFVVSPTRVPIPTGTVLGHWDIEPGQALSMTNVHEDMNMGMSLQGYPDGMKVTCTDGKNDDGEFRQIVLRPPETGTNDGSPDETLN